MAALGWLLNLDFAGSAAISIAANTEPASQHRVPPQVVLPVQMDPHLRQALQQAFAQYSRQVNWATAHTVQTAYQLVTAGADLVLADASSGTVTVALIDAAKWRDREIRVKKIDPGSNTVIIQPQSGQTVDGTACATISVQYGTMRLFSDGSDWWKS